MSAEDLASRTPDRSETITSLSPTGHWYRSNYPRSPLTDDQVRCLDVLAEADRLYNWHRTGRRRLDGGFRPCGEGVEVRLRFGSFSTYDDNRLTRLVVAAHRHAVRVAIGASGGLLTVHVHPRSHVESHWRMHHPDLEDLVARCRQA